MTVDVTSVRHLLMYIIHEVLDVIQKITPLITQTIFFQTHPDFGIPKVKSYVSDFGGEIWCEDFKYFRRNQRKCCLEIRLRGHHTLNKTTLFKFAGVFFIAEKIHKN